MIKLTFCLHRLPGLTRQAFQDYWYGTHAPLVARHAQVLRIRRYVQLHSAATPLDDALRGARGAPAGYDGVAELWWDSLDDMLGNDGDAARDAGAELLEDERRFIDLARSPLWFGEEKVIVGS
ncbi:MAG: EthD domain-containing protein [Alphaproteobacteria bacterium]|nr:EthD domain-containing protein [Alphaproteobacteria bacterium]